MRCRFRVGHQSIFNHCGMYRIDYMFCLKCCARTKQISINICLQKYKPLKHIMTHNIFNINRKALKNRRQPIIHPHYKSCDRYFWQTGQPGWPLTLFDTWVTTHVLETRPGAATLARYGVASLASNLFIYLRNSIKVWGLDLVGIQNPFHTKWDKWDFFVMLYSKCVFICQSIIAIPKKRNVERHF